MVEDTPDTQAPDEIEILFEDDEDEVVAVVEDEDGDPPEEVVDDDVLVIDADEVQGTEVDGLKKEVQELRESYLRKLAEFDNFRKRTERERAELIRTAGEIVVRELIPVLDNFERALQHASDTDPEAFRLGVEMISKQLFDVLQRQGLEVWNPVGEPFQPEFHEALQRVEDSGQQPGTVVWVLAKGYAYGGKLLRPAMVGVAVEPTGPAESPDLQVEGETEGEGES